MKSTLFTTTVALALALITAGALRADTFGNGTTTNFTLDFVTVGNPGNAVDDTGYGAVADTFRMGTYEVSRDMINKANDLGNLGVTLADMAPYGGNGVDKPATGVSWNEAARFVNWLNVNAGYTAAYKFNVQSGGGGYSANAYLVLWAPTDVGYNASNLYRNSNAKYVLPSENEWYKAAFYSLGGTYYNYATGSDAIPTAVAGGTASGTAVYDGQGGPTNITMAGGLSPYGTMGQDGNVWEWSESAYDGANSTTSENRGIRGGDWLNSEGFLRSSYRNYFVPTYEGLNFGFRVASVTSVPEPSTYAMLGAGALGLLALRRRRA
ncbi:MAG: formylglycine-generating enzyme family protein [Verrucomicrobiia bacterium]